MNRNPSQQNLMTTLQSQNKTATNLFIPLFCAKTSPSKFKFAQSRCTIKQNSVSPHIGNTKKIKIQMIMMSKKLIYYANYWIGKTQSALKKHKRNYIALPFMIAFI